MPNHMPGGAQEAGRDGAEAAGQLLFDPAEHPFGQIRVGQVPGRAAERGEEAEAPGQGHAGDAEQAPSAAEGAADPGFEPAEDRDAGALVVGEGLEEFGPQAGAGPAAELARGGVGLAEALRQGVPGRGRAAGPGVGGEPEHGVEARARVADGAAGAAAEGHAGGGRGRGGGRRSHGFGFGLGFGGAEHEEGEDGPLGVGERLPGPFGGVAAVLAQAAVRGWAGVGHGGGGGSDRTGERNTNLSEKATILGRR
jgi:hypothetical protein